MDFLDRYLAAIGRELPEKQRADITAELRDVLMNRVEEREAELGRPLDGKELEALLHDYGHPLVVAGRYRSLQYLIGPEIYPFWWKTLKVVLAWVAAAYVVLAALAFIVGELPRELANSAESSLVATLITAFGVVTLVAAFMERYGKRTWLTTWHVRDLPPVQGRRPSTFDLVVEVGMGFVALLWWMGVINFRSFIPEWGMTLSLAPIWKVFYWPIVAYFVVEIASNLLALARPGMALTNGLLRAGRYVIATVVLSLILRDGHFVEVMSNRIPEETLAQVQANFDLGFKLGITATVLFMAGYAAWMLWKVRGVLAARRPVGASA